MQARNRHQVRHTGGSKDIPVGTLNGVLIPHHQGGNQAGLLPICHLRLNAFAHLLACALHRVLPGGGQALGGQVFGSGAHIARGLDALLPRPQLVVKAVRIAVAMRGLQAHRELPALARLQRRGLALQLIRPVRTRLHAGVPAQVNAFGHAHRLALQLGRLHIQPKAQHRLMALWHGRHHTHHRDVAPFQVGLQAAG